MRLTIYWIWVYPKISKNKIKTEKERKIFDALSNEGQIGMSIGPRYQVGPAAEKMTGFFLL